MSLNPFATVSDYPSTLNKIAIYTFFVALGATALINWQVPALGRSLPYLAVKIPETDIQISLLKFIIAALFAFLSRAVKLHDRVSDVFGIRKRFDICAILVPMASAAGGGLSIEQQEKIVEKRKTLMSQVFYKYASSSPGKAQIEQHAITMALDQWSWFWICVEALFIGFTTAIVLSIYRQFEAADWLLIANFLLLWLMQGIKQLCQRYALDEIRQILAEPSRKRAVQEVFHAL